MKIPAHLQFTAEMTIEAAKDGEDQEGPVDFSMLANTGSPMKLSKFANPVVVELSGLEFGQTMPVLEDHDPSRRVGHTTYVARRDGSVHVKGKISATGTTAQTVLADARSGFPFQASIGADVSDAVFLEKGRSMTVNGKRVKGPMLVARKARMYEVSVTALGADTATSFSVSASSEGGQTIGVLSMSFEQFVSDLGLDKDSLTEDQLSNLQAKFDSGTRVGIQASVVPEDDPEPTPAAPEPDVSVQLQAMREAVDAESDRLESIQEIAKREEFKIVATKDRNAMRKKAIKEEWSPEQFELELHRARRPVPGDFAIHVTADRSDRNAVECAIVMGLGTIREDELANMYDEKTINLAASRQYQGYGLHRLMHETLQAAGMHYRPGQYDHEFIRTVKRADSAIKAAGDFSTVDTSGILSNIQNKILLNSFKSQDPTLGAISATGSVRDFKTMTGYRMTGVGEFQVVAPGGEIKDMSLGEESYQLKADTYGAKITLSRTQIINDDLGAFAGVPRAIGRAAKMKLHDVAYNEFLDDASFFSVGNNNLITDVLSIDGLTAAVQKFMQQVDINEKPIDLMPMILLTGTNNAVLAQQLYVDTRVVVAGSGDVYKTDGNPHVNKYSPYSTRWTDANIATGGNGSDTAWWLLTDDPDAACLEIRYLNGVSTPVIEEQPTAPDVLGMMWVGYFDFGVSKKEFRGGVKSSGTV